MKKLFQNVLFISLIITSQLAIAQVDNYAKNSKLFDDEELRFENELKTNPDSAEVYWKHGNVTASFTFNAQKDAWKYFEKALSFDSSKVIYFVDYGKYLQTMKYYSAAKILYARALKIFPEDNDLLYGAKSTENYLSANQKITQLSDYGKAPNPLHPKAPDYAKVIDFDNLIAQTTDKKSEYNYDKLIEKFIKGTELSDAQVYMLLIGFTQKPEYNPYTAEADVVFKLNDEKKFTEAITEANKLLETNPILPALYKELIYAHRNLGDEERAEENLKKLHSILNAMLYTGDGSCDKPYVTLWLKEEYTLLKYLDYKKTGAVDITTCAGLMADKIHVTHITTNQKSEICFNTYLIFKEMMEK